MECRSERKSRWRILDVVSSVLDRFCIVSIILFLVITTVATVLVTASMPRYLFDIEFVPNSTPMVLIGNAILIGLFGTRRFMRILDSLSINLLTTMLIAYIVVVGLFWVVLANVWPDFDSKDVENIAIAINKGTTIPKDAYASRFPHQIPFALLISLFQWIFGSASYSAFEVLNVFSVVGTAVALKFLAHVLFDDPRVEKMTIILTWGFIPLIL